MNKWVGLQFVFTSGTREEGLYKLAQAAAYFTRCTEAAELAEEREAACTVEQLDELYGRASNAETLLRAAVHGFQGQFGEIEVPGWRS